MNRMMQIIGACALVGGLAGSVLARCGCDQTCAPCSAGECCGGPVCVGSAEMVEVEKHCYNVECEKVCIPAVRFPWERGGNKLTLLSLFKGKKGCGRTGCGDTACDGCASIGCGDGCASAGCDVCVPAKRGHVRAVRDLIKKTFKTKECKHTLALADKATGCCGAVHCQGGCDAGGHEMTDQADQPTADSISLPGYPAYGQSALDQPVFKLDLPQQPFAAPVPVEAPVAARSRASTVSPRPSPTTADAVIEAIEEASQPWRDSQLPPPMRQPLKSQPTPLDAENVFDPFGTSAKLFQKAGEARSARVTRVGFKNVFKQSK